MQFIIHTAHSHNITLSYFKQFIKFINSNKLQQDGLYVFIVKEVGYGSSQRIKNFNNHS